MLTRLKVDGFKNLVEVDVRFGPFTCIAGANGVGKSNLFDAILFLSALADRPLIDAALSVRGTGGRAADVRSLFHRVGTTYADKMSFEAEMIVPGTGVDDLGQAAEASITFLRYGLKIAYRGDDSLHAFGALEVVEEKLTHINLGDAREHLPFPHKAAWRATAVRGRRTSALISTDEGEGGPRVIKQHQDGKSGRPLSRLAVNLPRTVLSAASAAESPTALLARNEMRSWRLLQLEPSSLRRPDEFTTPATLGVDGANLPATLYHLARSSGNGVAAAEAEARVYARVANRLAELIDDVRTVTVDRDEKRELLTLLVTDRSGTAHPARALSDGTLRFLALTVLDQELGVQGLLCLEEPENGIHPERIPAMLRLIQDIATDVDEEVGTDNPLRQVIVNTHAPAVVMQVPDDSLVVAELQEVSKPERGLFKRVCFSGLTDTWREKASGRPGVSKGALMAYLNPVEPGLSPPEFGQASRKPKSRRVIDRPELQQWLFPPISDE